MDTNKPPLAARNFPTAEEEAAVAAEPSRYAGPESAYRLAFTDTDFLLREELRPVRMQLELLKPEMMQQEQGIESTIVIFGSARITPPEDAALALEAARAGADVGGGADQADVALVHGRAFRCRRRIRRSAWAAGRSRSAWRAPPRLPRRFPRSAPVRCRRS